MQNIFKKIYNIFFLLNYILFNSSFHSSFVSVINVSVIGISNDFCEVKLLLRFEFDCEGPL